MGASYLAHHGVKGMKWGEWNDETKRKYGLLKTAAGGGGVGEEDEEEKDAKKQQGYTSGDYRKDVDSLVAGITSLLGKKAENALNAHLSAIQTGNISLTEAQVLSIVNAAAKTVGGESAIVNPKGGTAYDDDYEIGYKQVKNGKLIVYN